MTDYKKYINALRKCAKEHENDRTLTGQIIVSNLCEAIADLLEELSGSEISNKSEIPTGSIVKNDVAVDCIPRADVNRIICEYRDDAAETGTERGLERAYGANAIGALISELPSVTPQKPRCKECKWWKDSDGKYRRGLGAESRCPINSHAVYCGDGYCYMFSPKIDMREVEK